MVSEGGLVELRHELSGPMMVIRWNLEVARSLLQEGEEPLGSEQRGRTLEAIEAAIQGMEHASRMVRSWRGARGSRERSERLDVGALVTTVVKMTRGWLEERAVISLHAPLGEVFVDGAEIRLRQVLLNLLDNAYHAIPGEQRERNEISIRVESRGEQSIVEVSDSGAGIAPELARQLGEPFVSARPGGTGLGLNLCSEIVWEHGGRLELESEVGRGTLVRVCLPAARANSEAPAESERETPTVKPPRATTPSKPDM